MPETNRIFYVNHTSIFLKDNAKKSVKLGEFSK